ncbi:MAG: class I SAM-dependent methyltransferase [Alphaproteobacteria bacterium]|nr:class I SAM-dependent methyltransferase [Alphaproteobacteria bacterium]
MTDDRVLRLIWDDGFADFQAFINTDRAREEIAAGRVVGTRLIERSDAEAELGELGDVAGENRGTLAAVAEHDKLSFASYPYEWPADMLYAAGVLTLDLAAAFQRDGLGLKDATPFNVQFRGPTPLLVDVLSFERRDPMDFTWLAEGQFIRTFVLPLLALRYFGIHPHQLFLTHRDGLEPEEVYRMNSGFRRLTPPFLGLVTLPTWLAGKGERLDHGRKRQAKSDEQATFILASVFKRLRRALDRVRPGNTGGSHWSRYMQEHSYDEHDFRTKERFVHDTLTEAKPRQVLDVGCNTGHFSALAAQLGADVVAIDLDPAVVGAVWRRASQDGLPILPLVQNLARPSPAVGWNYREGSSFLDRATKGFDAVLMLAVIHHMMVTEGIPLEEIISLAAGLTRGSAVIEFVAPGDPMFVRIARGRDSLYRGLDAEAFESAAETRFAIAGKEQLENPHRILYRLQLRQ